MLPSCQGPSSNLPSCCRSTHIVPVCDVKQPSLESFSSCLCQHMYALAMQVKRAKAVKEAEHLPTIVPDFSEENLARLQSAADLRYGPPRGHVDSS